MHARLFFLGPFVAECAGQARSVLQRQPALQLVLAYLALHPGVPLSRAQVAFTLWPDTSESQARANLRQALYTLRNLFDQNLPIDTGQQTIRLCPGPGISVDLWDFSACVEAANSDPLQIRQAVALYRGDLLAGQDADWLVPFREQYRLRYYQALEYLADYADRQGNLAEAIDHTRALLASDPYQEHVARALMRRLERHGDRAAALACYAQLQRLLQAELGVPPMPETVALAESIAQGAATAERRHNLPGRPTAFVGREREMALLDRLLRDPACRIITLVGPGGIGKTRLAVEAAAAHLSTFADGVCFVGLAGISDPTTCMATLAEALQLSLQEQASPFAQVVEYLRAKHFLLVLDNFEQLLPVAHMLTDLIDAAAGPTILVTSRQRLHLQGEWLLDLSGLPIPQSADPTTIAHSSAAQLLLQRARMVYPAFADRPDDSEAIVRICRYVDGMPLGLELVASWARTLSAVEIADELARGFDLLVTTAPDVPTRHRSMRAVFDHSWQLLNRDEQRALRQLAVFRGGFERDAALSVAGASLSLLAALIDKSLLRWDGSWRYDLHELVRQYAYEQLVEANERALARHRHLQYYLKLAETAAPVIAGKERGRWLARLDAEHENMRAVLRWAIDQGQAEEAARLANALVHFWRARGLASHGQYWLEQVLRQSAELSPALHADVLYGTAFLVAVQANYDYAAQLYQQCLELREALGDHAGVAAALVGLGETTVSQGDYGQAQRYLEASLAAQRAANSPAGVARTLSRLAFLAFNQGDHRSARTLLEEALELSRALGDLNDVGYCLLGLGQTLLASGEYAEARRCYQECMTMWRASGSHEGMAWVLEGVSALAVVDDAPLLAARLLGAAEVLRETIRAPLPPWARPQYERLRAALGAQLDSQALRHAWDAGRGLTWQQASAEALAVLPAIENDLRKP